MATARTHHYGKKVVKKRPSLTERLVKLFAIVMAVVIAIALIYALSERMF